MIDARNVWRPADVIRGGLRYQGIGVPSAPATARGPVVAPR